ncbi:MAG: DUF4910 domain-containing protein [Candidatus Heimdallarchaeota archaeon]|nr:DUF4910 domain-containing protein [Candidatus Heimdallarchaeota archaeon]
MFKLIFKTISKEFSGKNAKEIIAGIANFHRIQSSPGFRSAIMFCKERLDEYSIPQIIVHQYPAKGDNYYWSCPVPKEWAIKSASLDLIEPNQEKLCRFFEIPCSVIQRSAATPKEGLIGEVVILPKDLSPKEIREVELKDKFVLTNDPDLKKVRYVAVKEKGALGIIYDHVTELPPIRTRMNFPTARRYTSFWYGQEKLEGDALGFVLSAQQGEELRTLIEKVSKENNDTKKENEKKKKVKVCAKIDSKFYDGKMEVLEFCIPGKESSQEVLAVAHICHPKPSAVDNASGCGTLVEVARTLQSLISEGKLEQPRRGIRFLLVAEFTGTFCYLASNENRINDFIAGINLDMVGADQTVGGGRTLVLERTHNSTPSFVNDLLSIFLQEAAKEVFNFSKTSAFATFKYALDQPFSGGSDHHILNDPDIGIGAPMLIQWPDKFYHSSEDTIEKVCEKMTHKVGTIAAAYCYFIANMQLPALIWLANEITSKSKGRITNQGREIINELSNMLTKGDKKEKEEQDIGKKTNNQPELSKGQHLTETLEKVESELNFRKEVELKTLESLKRLVLTEKEKAALEGIIIKKQKDLEDHLEREKIETKNAVEKIAEALAIVPEELPKPENGELERAAKKIVPKRVFKGPITSLSLTDIDIEEQQEFNDLNKEFPKMKATLQSAFFWINGKRTISEIADLVKNDLGKINVPYLVKGFRLYEKHGLLELKNDGRR